MATSCFPIVYVVLRRKSENCFLVDICYIELQIVMIYLLAVGPPATSLVQSTSHTLDLRSRRRTNVIHLVAFSDG